MNNAPPTFRPRKKGIYWYRLGDLQDVGVNRDGTLHNPNGYPAVRLQQELAQRLKERDEAIAERRRAGAGEAAVKRLERTEKRLYQAAKRIVAGWDIADRAHCEVCRKALTDEQSIARGIGPECWQHVLGRIDWVRRQHGAVSAPTTDLGRLWFCRKHEQEWEEAPIINTTETHVLVFEKARSTPEGARAIPENIHAIDRAALEKNGWADYGKGIGGMPRARYFPDAGRVEVDRRRAGPVIYPLLGLPVGVSRSFVWAAYHRADSVLHSTVAAAPDQELARASYYEQSRAGRRTKTRTCRSGRLSRRDRAG